MKKLKEVLKQNPLYEENDTLSPLSSFLINTDYIYTNISFYDALQVLPIHRLKNQMIKFLPIFNGLDKLLYYIFYDEMENDYPEVFLEFSLVFQYMTLKQNFILEKMGEIDKKYYVVIDGEVAALGIEYKKESVTDEEYYFHLVKLELLKENYLLKKCKLLNKDKYPIKDESIASYLQKLNNENISYNILKSKIINYINENYHLNLDKKVTFKYILDINDYINMMQKSSISLNTKATKNDFKSVLLPYYYIKHRYYKGDFFTDFTFHNKHFYEYTFITLKKCNLGYVNKESYQSYFQIFKRYKDKIKKILYNYQKLYIFNFIPEDILINDYSNYFSIRELKKGDKLFAENTEYFGVYILLNGEITISTYRNYHELSALKMIIKNSISEYGYFSLKSNTVNEKGKKGGSQKETDDEDLKELFFDPMILTNEFKVSSKIRRTRYLLKISKPEIFGLCDCYDSSNSIYYVTAEIISDDAHFLFMDKNSFDHISQIDSTVSQKILQILKTNSVYLCSKINEIMHNIKDSIRMEIMRNERKNQNKNKTKNHQIMLRNQPYPEEPAALFNSVSGKKNKNNNIISPNKDRSKRIKSYIFEAGTSKYKEYEKLNSDGEFYKKNPMYTTLSTIKINRGNRSSNKTNNNSLNFYNKTKYTNERSVSSINDLFNFSCTFHKTNYSKPLVIPNKANKTLVNNFKLYKVEDFYKTTYNYQKNENEINENNKKNKTCKNWFNNTAYSSLNSFNNTMYNSTKNSFNNTLNSNSKKLPSLFSYKHIENKNYITHNVNS